jgi:hypothetical protein
LEIIREDMAEVANGAPFNVHTINKDVRLYWYSPLSNRSSWQVQFDAHWNTVANECERVTRQMPMPPDAEIPEGDPRNREFSLANVNVSELFELQPNGTTQLTLTIKGNLPQA